MTPFECMRRMYYREFLICLKHLDAQLETPDRHDWYLMQISTQLHDILHMFSKKHVTLEPKRFKLAFTQEGRPVKLREKTKEELDEISKRMQAQHGFMNRTSSQPRS